MTDDTTIYVNVTPSGEVYYTSNNTTSTGSVIPYVSVTAGTTGGVVTRASQFYFPAVSSGFMPYNMITSIEDVTILEGSDLLLSLPRESIVAIEKAIQDHDEEKLKGLRRILNELKDWPNNMQETEW
jgi:hypothetical protein